MTVDDELREANEALERLLGEMAALREQMAETTRAVERLEAEAGIPPRLALVEDDGSHRDA